MEGNNLNTRNSKQPVNTLANQLRQLVPTILEVITLLVYVIYYIAETIVKTIYPPPLKSIRNEVVLVTGAGHGIGKELALLYASEGARVVCWDVNEESNNATVKEIESLGYVKASSYVCDVSKRENVVKTAKKVIEEVGDVTVIINNAGIMPTHPLQDHTEEEIDKIMKINVYAHFWIIQEFLPGMKKLNHGHIVALSSVAGLLGLKNLVPYCASKYAVRGLMEALGEELRTNRENNIKITTIFPYMVDTGLCKKPVIKFPSIMPLLKPKDVAKAIMKAQRTDVVETSVPPYLYILNNYSRWLPVKATIKIKDFFDSGVDSDLL